MPRCSSDVSKSTLAKTRSTKPHSRPDASPTLCRCRAPAQGGGSSSALGQRDGLGDRLQQSWERVASCTTKELCGCSIKLLVTLGERRALPLTMGHS